MKFERYDSYKDIEVDWLEEIPKEWQINKIKQSCSLVRDGTHGSFRRVEVGYPLLSVRNIKNSVIEFLSDDSFISEKDYKLIASSFKIKKGDLQLAIIGATMGKVAIVSKMKPFVTQRSLATVRSRNWIINNKYLFYFFQSKYFHNLIWNTTSFSAQPGIYLTMLQNIFTPLPTIKIQNEIVNYLDTKTQKIDKEISILEQKIEKYKELKQTLISETVLKGLDKNAELRNSQIEWIGDIPKYWRVKRIEDIAKILNGYAFSSDSNVSIGINVIKMSNLKNGKVIITDNNHKNIEDITLKRFLLKENDILLGLSGSIENYALVKKDILPAYLNQRVCSIKATKNDINKFLFYVIQSKYYKEQIIANVTGTTITNLSSYIIQKSFISMPPYDEQVKIANYLDEKTSKIDSIVEVIGKKIEVLKEFRKTLINDVVTGKVKVA